MNHDDDICIYIYKYIYIYIYVYTYYIYFYICIYILYIIYVQCKSCSGGFTQENQAKGNVDTVKSPVNKASIAAALW